MRVRICLQRAAKGIPDSIPLLLLHWNWNCLYQFSNRIMSRNRAAESFAVIRF